MDEQMEFPVELLGYDGPMSDDFITGDHEALAEKFSAMSGLDAIRVLLMISRRHDCVVSDREIDDFAEYLGVFFEDGET